MNGFFNQEALAALQSAYEMQLTPEEMDIDQHTGLPTNVVSNTSPWHGSVDLWKYPNGVTKLETSPIMYSSKEGEYEDEDEEEAIEGPQEEEGLEEEALSDEEIDSLIEELLNSDN
jgi:hypothetical protein